MTTQVTIRANGPCYPVRITTTDKHNNQVSRLLPGGDSTEFHLPLGVTLTVAEEYWPEGYAPS